MGSTKNHLNEISEVISLYRGLILDLSEQAIGHYDFWPYFRGRLLGLLGNKGLDGRIQAILEENSNGNQ